VGPMAVEEVAADCTHRFGACILPLAGLFGLSVPSPGTGESEARL
jgi:hypothetical protein